MRPIKSVCRNGFISRDCCNALQRREMIRADEYPMFPRTKFHCMGQACETHSSKLHRPHIALSVGSQDTKRSVVFSPWLIKYRIKRETRYTERASCLKYESSFAKRVREIPPRNSAKRDDSCRPKRIPWRSFHRGTFATERKENGLAIIGT